MHSKRRAIIAGLALLLALGVSAAVWRISGLPPVSFVIGYGFPPVGGPTGRAHTDPVGGTCVEIGPGYFLRGSHRHCEEGDFTGRVGALIGLDWGTPPDHRGAEGCVEWVEVPNAFFLATTEVTNAQYERFRPDHERYDGRSDDPVVNVTFEDALAYCEWLSARGPGRYRLPTTTEWEYACRAGARTEYPFGDDPARLGAFAWFIENSDWMVHPVGTKAPNAWGIHDMLGNAEEHVDDLDPYAWEGRPWEMSWDGHAFTPEERARAIERLRALIREWVEDTEFVDEEGEEVGWVKPSWLSYWPAGLRRGGGFTHSVADCHPDGSSSTFGMPAGFRTVWVED